MSLDFWSQDLGTGLLFLLTGCAPGPLASLPLVQLVEEWAEADPLLLAPRPLSPHPQPVLSTEIDKERGAGTASVPVASCLLRDHHSAWHIEGAQERLDERRSHRDLFEFWVYYSLPHNFETFSFLNLFFSPTRWGQ